MWEFRVAKADRLDRSLREQGFAGAEWLSRQAWDSLFERGHVSVNGHKASKAGMIVNPGDEIRVQLPGPLGLLGAGAADPLWLAPDSSWGIFGKPAGIDTVALLPWDHSAFASKIAGFAAARGVPFAALANPPSLEGGLVQRLDRHTSGLVCAAFTAAEKTRLRALFSGGGVEKTYDALVTRSLASGEYRAWLATDGGARVRSWAEAKEGAEEVSLRVLVYRECERGAWLKVRTRFGRRHVVRASLAALGAPLLGDSLYGGAPEAPYYQLHAGALELPFSREKPERFELAPPEAFLALAAGLGLN